MTTAVNTELANGVCAPAYVVIEMGTDLPSGTAPSLFQQNVRATEGNASGQTRDGASRRLKGIFWLLITLIICGAVTISATNNTVDLNPILESLICALDIAMNIIYNILNETLDNQIHSKGGKEEGSVFPARPAEGERDANAMILLFLTNLTAGALRSCHQEELAQWLEQRTGTRGDHLLPDPNGESRLMKVKLQILITLIKCITIAFIYFGEKLQQWSSSYLANERRSQ